jgi:L-Ala-D/L-Glu epimerase
VSFVEIVECSARPLSVPTVDPFVISSGAVQATRSVLVRVGIRNYAGHIFHGLGEAACLPPVTTEDQPHAHEALQHVAGQLLGRRVDELEALAGFLELLPHHPVARAGLEVALLDALARSQRKPLHQFISGSSASAAPVDTDITIPLLGAERMAELARQWVSKGFTSLKIKVGQNVDADLRSLEAMLRAAPSAKYRPDANGGLSVASALAFIQGAKRLGAIIECFEQPCATNAQMAEVAAKIDPPVVADESVKSVKDFERLVQDKAADGVNLKIAKSGSFLRARAIGLAAREKNMPIMVGGMVETRLGMTAAAHLAASLGGIAFADLDTAWLLQHDPFVGGYSAKGATIELPDTPGLGLSTS